MSLVGALSLSCPTQVNLSHRQAWIVLTGKGYLPLPRGVFIFLLQSRDHKEELGCEGIKESIPSFLFDRRQALDLYLFSLGLGQLFSSFVSVPQKLVKALKEAFVRDRVLVEYLFIYNALKHSVTYTLPGFWLSLHAVLICN